VLRENEPVLKLSRQLGFHVADAAERDVAKVVLNL
jgi:hypothetical protein